MDLSKDAKAIEKDMLLEDTLLLIELGFSSNKDWSSVFTGDDTFYLLS